MKYAAALLLLAGTFCGCGADAVGDPRDAHALQATRFRRSILYDLEEIRADLRGGRRADRAADMAEAYGPGVDPGIPDDHPQAQIMRKLHDEMTALQGELAGSASEQDVDAHLEQIEKLAESLPESVPEP